MKNQDERKNVTTCICFKNKDIDKFRSLVYKFKLGPSYLVTKIELLKTVNFEIRYSKIYLCNNALQFQNPTLKRILRFSSWISDITDSNPLLKYYSEPLLNPFSEDEESLDNEPRRFT